MVRQRLGSRLAFVVAVVLVATSCQYARAGTRCAPPNAWGHDDTYLLWCRDGRWQRVMTLEEYARRLRGDAEVKGAVLNRPPALPPSPPGPAFRVVWALPADANPPPDMAAAVRQELGIVDQWLADQTGGRRLRYAPSGAPVGITTIRMPQTSAQLAAAANPFGLVAEAIFSRGLPGGSDALLVYAQVAHPNACGEGVARLAVVWTRTCAGPSRSVTAFPTGSTFVTAHELLHALGAVPGCAPHWDGTGHVGDDPRDLLYQPPPGGPGRDFDRLRLDPGRDDYYGHRRAGCLDAAASVYWY